MLIAPYNNDRLFEDGLTTLDVDGPRFEEAKNSIGNPLGKIILDIGAYPGTAYEIFGKQNDYIAYGLFNDEFTQSLVSNRVKFIHQNIQADTNFTYDADIFLFQEVLEHIRLPKFVLMKIYNGMKPGALLYITTNNCFYFGYILKLAFGKKILDPIDSDDYDYPGHCRYYSKEELKDFFERLGARVTLYRRVNFLPPVSCYRKEKRLLALLKLVFAKLMPNLYATHIELVIIKPEK